MKIRIYVLFFFSTFLSYSQGTEESWPEIYNSQDANYWQKKTAFYDWYKTVKSDSLLMDTIVKTHNYKKFRRFEAHYESMLDSEGSFKSYNSEMLNYLNNNLNESSNNCTGQDWQFASFNKTPPNSFWAKGMGVTNNVWVNPNNKNHLITSTFNGGLWKTINGGNNWENISDGIGLSLGISSFAVDPNNTNIIYLGTGFVSYVTDVTGGYGIFKTVDGGNTWNQTSLSFSGPDYGVIKKIVIDPINTQNVYAIASRQWNQIYPNGFFKSTDGFQTHSFKYIYNPHDIVLKANDPTVITIVARDSIYNSSDRGLTFNASSVNILSRYHQGCLHDAKFATEINNPNTLMLLYRPLDTCKHEQKNRIDISYDNGISWDSLTTYFDYQGGFKCSPTDTSVFYVGGVLLYKFIRNSSNGLSSKIQLDSNRVGVSSWGNVNYGSNGTSWMHSDIRDILVIDSSGIDIIYTSNDAGVSKSYTGCSLPFNQYCWKLITGEGLTITQFHGIGIHHNDSNVFYGGAQDGNGAFTLDNGNNWLASFNQSNGTNTDAGDIILYRNNTNRKAMINEGTAYFFHSNGISTLGGIGRGHYQARLLMTSEDIGIYCGVEDLFYNTFRPPAPPTYAVNKRLFISDSANANYINEFSVCEGQLTSITLSTDITVRNSGTYEGMLFNTNVVNPQANDDWNDITPDIPHLNWSQIYAVVTDPMNPNRIWIGLSGFSSAGTERIFYNDNGGTVNTYPGGWVDFSTGLPNLPIQEINYQRGSNDLIYAATDVGVFYRDATMSQWECFNNGLPPGVVNDIDISYCTGKMAISIYGRGAYKNNILNIPWEINTNTTWNEKRWLSVDLHVKSGKTLTIKDSLLIYPNVKIIVERGGKLIIDGGTLTTTCSNRFWHGIEVWGDAAQWQESAGIQGELEIKNGALIENAYEAVGLIKTDANGNNDFAYTGGIIKASNSIFRNCRRAVRFYSYHNTQGSVTYPNKSYFYKMIFETTDLLKEEDKPEAFVSMHAVDHIYFYQCTFRNTVPHLYDENERGSAIKSWDATYSIIPTCSSTPPTNQACPLGNIQMSTFKGLYYGIDARAINPMNPITVDYAQFENCIRGIYQKGINFTSLTRNEFVIPDADINDVYGIYSEGCYGYQIEENYFVGTGSGAERTSGICIYQSGTFDDEVYNNTFDELYIGALIMEQNGVEYSAGEGLELLCNDFTSFEYAIALTSNGIMDYHQGSMSYPTGNTFQPECPSGSGSESELYVDASSFPYEYYHHDNIITEPFCITPTLVTTYNTGILYKSKIDECPSKLEPFCPDCSIIIPTGLGRSASSNSTISNYEIKSKIRNFYKDTLLSNTRDSIVNFLGKNSLGLMNDYILAELELQKGNSITFKSKSNNLKVKGNYLPILDVLDWLENNSINRSSSNKITSNSQLIAASNSKKYGYANAENALTLISNNLYPETFVYPIKKKKVIGSQNKSKSADKKSVQFGIDIFPNPAKEQATISYHFDSKKQREIEVINNKGVVVDIVTVNNKDGQINIDLSNWAKGVYLFVVKNEADSNFIKRLVVTQ